MNTTPNSPLPLSLASRRRRHRHRRQLCLSLFSLHLFPSPLYTSRSHNPSQSLPNASTLQPLNHQATPQPAFRLSLHLRRPPGDRPPPNHSNPTPDLRITLNAWNAENAAKNERNVGAAARDIEAAAAPQNPTLLLLLHTYCSGSCPSSTQLQCFGIHNSSTAVSTTSQITYYVRRGEIETAQKLFDQTPHKNISSWNSLISGYFQEKKPCEAQRLFDKMPERNTISWNGLIAGYIKNGMVQKARKVFDIMPQRNVISWTSMVRGYVKEGMIEEAESLFWRMPEKNVVSWSVMLSGLVHEGRIDDARRLYDMTPVKDVITRTTMVGGLCSKGQLYEAREMFDSMQQRNVVSWTTMISGYVQNGKVDVARKLFEVMPEKNEVTWTAMLMGYIQWGRTDDAWELFLAMPAKPIIACNAMIAGLGENGNVSKARKVFDMMREKDNGTWSAIIKIYERKGFELEALSVFRMMLREGVRPHFPSLISILSVCASLATLVHGRQIHAHLLRSKRDDDIYLSCVLITMYMKCGDVLKAKVVFDRSSHKDIVMWNSLISGYAQHGLGDEALRVYDEMSSSGIQADAVTFMGVLSACSYSGKVKEGKEIFESMKSKYEIEPTTEHYACMVDLLGRAGQLKEALDLINEMPVKADAIVWGSLLGACRTHMNANLAEVAAKKLFQLEPDNSGPYVLLSQIYASKGRWGDVAKVRRNLKSVSKTPGCSWMEVDKEVHVFNSGDTKPHPEHMAIVKKWEKLGGMLREAGYNPFGAFAFHDVDEEEKALSLRHHSEKLAVAFGLLKLPEGVPIRVMKNLRVCGDCHAAIKLISKLTGREIILRDTHRFHHFTDGFCSCKDYW